MKKMEGSTFEELAERFAKIGTIDLRVDYLHSGLGKYFVASGSPLCAGKKLSVTRMELHKDEGFLIAVGKGSYILG